MQQLLANRRLERVALGFLGLNTLWVGVWAQFAPRSFYEGFPGLGRVWVAVDGPFNEHLIRDVGGLNLALTVVLAGAAMTLSRSLVIGATVAALLYGVPHVVYHLAHTDAMSTSDVVGSVGGLTLFALVAAALLLRSLRSGSAHGLGPEADTR
jgi:hypothetical protein